MSGIPLAPCAQAPVNGCDNSLELFLRGFAARDVAQPLASFDDTTSSSAIVIAVDAHGFEVIGIRQSGTLAAWLDADDVRSSEHPILRQFDPGTVLSDTAPLNDVVQSLRLAPHVFVRSLGQIGGHISRRDLQKPAMRMWLFGLITISELRVTRMIDACCPQESWRQYLSEGRVQKAVELQQDRSRRGQAVSLLDCLQFADKGQIVVRDERLREQTRFSSKRQVEDFVSALQDLRNNLAHAQDLSGDWEVICELATNLQRIVLGPVQV
jgi:hypothetical protein